MSTRMQVPQAGDSRRGEFLILLFSAVVSLAPYLVYRALFARLFWFGDELDQIDHIDRLGFWHWVLLFFGENFVPLFKVLWGGAALLFGGSYAAMITLVWLTHALNVALLGRLMRGCGLSWAAVFLAQALFGLSCSNLETLAWSVQGSPVLSITFLLLAMDACLREGPLALQVGWVAASAVSFARGVLTGPVVAVGLLLDPGSRGRPWTLNRARAVAAVLLPSAVGAALIAVFASGNHQHMKGHGAEAFTFGLWYYCANPMHALLSVESYGWHTVAVLGAIKLALVVAALARTPGRTRVLFMMLVAFELGNAVLLGIGRYHTGLPSTLASRYQYASLLAAAPVAGFWFSRLCGLVPGGRFAGRAVATVVLLGLGLTQVRAWAGVLEPFTSWRGSESRRILFVDPNPRADAVPGIPGMDMDRAKALIRRYTLH